MVVSMLTHLYGLKGVITDIEEQKNSKNHENLQIQTLLLQSDINVLKSSLCKHPYFRVVQDSALKKFSSANFWSYHVFER